MSVIALGFAATGVAGCGSSSSGAAAAPSDSGLSGSITVFAAASLTESFTTLGQQFEAANPGVKVTFSFAASSALATQITNGAPADVFASASTKNMDQVVTAGYASNPTTFAKNVMEVAVPPANPANVASVDDLAKPAVKVALCQPQVPCGSTAEKVFTNAKITVTPVTQEPDVKSVLSKVTLGEVDAGVVYVTDVMAAGSTVKGIEIPADVNASTSYPIASVSKSQNLAAAQAFVAYVLSPAGSAVLATAGFEKP
ncbi:MAG: molybdate ABC transporter substrate-binding protein [Candidatus Nanopelagicales bacterium]